MSFNDLMTSVVLIMGFDWDSQVSEGLMMPSGDTLWSCTSDTERLQWPNGSFSSNWS